MSKCVLETTITSSSLGQAGFCCARAGAAACHKPQQSKTADTRPDGKIRHGMGTPPAERPWSQFHVCPIVRHASRRGNHTRRPPAGISPPGICYQIDGQLSAGFGQPKAWRNSGKLATDPSTRQRTGLCTSLPTCRRTASGRSLVRQLWAKAMKKRWSGVKPSIGRQLLVLGRQLEGRVATRAARRCRRCFRRASAGR